MTKRFSLALIALLGLSAPLQAEPDPGAFLAARQAGLTNDFAAAARYFTRALAQDPGNQVLRENTLSAYMALGQFDRALPVAQQMLDDGQESQMASLALLSDAVAQEDWDGVFALLEAGHQVGPLVDELAQAWAFVGQGKMSQALETFDGVAETRGLRSFGMTHKAFALAMVGDLEGADALLGEPAQSGVVPTRGTVLSHVQVLARLGRFEDAQALMADAFGDVTDPSLDPVRAALAAGEVPDSATVETPGEGVAYVLLSLADALREDANATFLLMYARAAAHIDPARAGAQVAAARILDDMGRHDLAADTFALVQPEDAEFPSAELGRAEALRASGRPDAAIEVLTQLGRQYDAMPVIHASLGDIHRQAGDYDKANAAYTAALDRYSDEDPARWWVRYVRGITFERLGEWPEAEADFRAALELSPGQPSVLNYLGYSMVEMGINLDEALGMIEEAAKARPDNGAIIDSLGWVLYKLGRYEEAVATMERAVVLEPVDPVVTDHLGDVYWMVGREDEARFQWHRALSFDPEPEEATRIRRKLEVGLTQVLAEEGEDPADMAYDRQ